MLLRSRFTHSAARILLAVAASVAAVTALAQEPADFTIPPAQPAPVTNNVAVTPWCQITPDLQVIAPFRERADASLLFGFRAKMDF